MAAMKQVWRFSRPNATCWYVRFPLDKNISCKCISIELTALFNNPLDCNEMEQVWTLHFFTRNNWRTVNFKGKNWQRLSYSCNIAAESLPYWWLWTNSCSAYLFSLRSPTIHHFAIVAVLFHSTISWWNCHRFLTLRGKQDGEPNSFFRHG